MGCGYNGFWTPQHIAEVSSSQGWPIAVGHSVYLDLLLGVGAVGLLLALPVPVLAMAQAARQERQCPGQGYAFVLAIVVLCLFDGLLESNVLLPRFVPLLAMAGISMLAFQPCPPLLSGSSNTTAGDGVSTSPLSVQSNAMVARLIRAPDAEPNRCGTSCSPPSPSIACT